MKEEEKENDKDVVYGSTTTRLESYLKKTHPGQSVKGFTKQFLKDNEDDLLKEAVSPFHRYFKETLKSNKKKQTISNILLKAGIPEGYGYKIISGEKKTKQRDIIIRILYEAEFSLEQVQRALTIYGMAPLYAKIPRDAVIMICINEHPGGIDAVNDFLTEEKMEPLNGVKSQEEESFLRE